MGTTHQKLTVIALAGLLALAPGSITSSAGADPVLPTLDIIATPSGQPAAPVMVIAHRGASSYRPEHTFPSYDLAVEMDTDMLECDVQLTADEQLVCIHDTTVDRTARDRATGERVSGNVSDHTLAELRSYEWGSWKDVAFTGADVVPLAEQLLCYRRVNPRMRFHLETKAPPATGRMEEVLVEMLDRLGYIPEGPADAAAGLILIQSFDPASLARMKELAPSLPTVILGAAGYFPPMVPVPETFDAVSPGNANVRNDPTFIDRMHDQGKLVHTYTVNDPEVMDELLDLGIDGIFTDRPDVLRERVDRRGTGVPTAERGNPEVVDPGCPGVAGTVNSIEDVPETPHVDAEPVRSDVRRGSSVPVRFSLRTADGAVSDDDVIVELVRPDGSHASLRHTRNDAGRRQAVVRTDRRLPGRYHVVVHDAWGFELGRIPVDVS